MHASQIPFAAVSFWLGHGLVSAEIIFFCFILLLFLKITIIHQTHRGLEVISLERVVWVEERMQIHEV